MANASMATIRADLSQYYAMKSLFERILGRSSFRKLKDFAPLGVWKAESRKLVSALDLSIQATVAVVDDAWKTEVKDLLVHGRSRIDSAKSIDELFAALAATLVELSFLQVGFVPKGHIRVDRVALTAQNWRLDPVRSVQYVQSPARSGRAPARGWPFGYPHRPQTMNPPYCGVAKC